LFIIKCTGSRGWEESAGHNPINQCFSWWLRLAGWLLAFQLHQTNRCVCTRRTNIH
jgi:hypothetical protein